MQCSGSLAAAGTTGHPPQPVRGGFGSQYQALIGSYRAGHVAASLSTPITAYPSPSSKDATLDPLKPSHPVTKTGKTRLSQPRHDAW